MRPASTKGFKVVKEQINGRVVVRLERIAYYGLDTSAMLRQKKSQKARVISRAASLSFSNKKGGANT